MTILKQCSVGIFLLSISLSRLFADGTPAPYPTLTNVVGLPDGAVIFQAPIFPSAPGIQSTADSPSTSTNFQAIPDGLPLWQTSVPPDVHGAVGLNHVMTMLNTQVRIQSKTGSTNYSTVTLRDFWTNAGSFSSLFDPRIFYDRYNDRWIAVTMTDATLSSSALLIGVSQTGDPTGAWYKNKIKADASGTNWADYPSVGMTKDWIVVHANMYSIVSNLFTFSYMYVFDKTNVLAGGTNYTLLTDSAPVIEVPAITYDNSLSTMYLLSSIGNGVYLGKTNGYLRLYTITGSVSSPVFTASTYQAALPWGPAPTNDFLPQYNTTNKINAGDTRLQNVVYRNGSLWAVQTVFLPEVNPTRSAIQWWQIATNGAVVQAGRIDDPNGVNYYANPSIGVNRFNDVMIGFSKFSTNQYASANYSFQTLSEQRNKLLNDVILKAGQGMYNKKLGGPYNRWGDFSMTTVDPSNDADLWTIQEYAATPINTGAGTDEGVWGTWWGKVSAVVPINDAFTNAITLSGALLTTNGTLFRATGETNEISHFGKTDTVSVWYSWTAPSSGQVSISLTNTASMDSGLATYTGTIVSSLTLVTNRHGGASFSANIFSATSNTTYYIAVINYNWGNYQPGAPFDLGINQPSAPIFTIQPRGRDVVAGSNVTFSAEAIASPAPTYQWQFNGTNIAGATAASFTTNNVQTNSTGNFTLIATNSFGSRTSGLAHLQVYDAATATFGAPSVTTNKQFRFIVSGVTNSPYVVEVSTNLINWTALATNIATFTNLDSSLTNIPYQFYRARYKP